MTSPRLIRVCAGCGQEWGGLYVDLYYSCEACGGLTSTHVAPETAARIAARYQDALLATIDGPTPAEWAEQDGEAEETHRLLFGGQP